MAFTAKDVQALRQATGAGMMDAKKALEANDGDMDASKQWLREKGLAASAKRDDRENNQGLVALVVQGNVGAIVARPYNWEPYPRLCKFTGDNVKRLIFCFDGSVT